MEVLCYDGVTLLYLDLRQYDWSGSLMLWRCETIVVLCYDNVTVLHFNVLTLCYYGSFMLWQCNIDVMMLWHYGSLALCQFGILKVCDAVTVLMVSPTPHKRVITIAWNPWSKGCPHIFPSLHLPGGGLQICGGTPSTRGIIMLYPAVVYNIQDWRKFLFWTYCVLSSIIFLVAFLPTFLWKSSRK